MSATILPFKRPIHDSIMSLHCVVPESAMTAELLGTERHSHAVQVSEDGLMLTVGYSVMEASEITLTNRKGQSSEAIILCQEYDSGLALIQPTQSLGIAWLEGVASDTVNRGDNVQILTSNSTRILDATVFAKEEYAGRWEYLLEQAFYTVPLCDDWSGAVMLDSEEKLCGIGSLALGLKIPDGEVVPGNLFVPTDLVLPHLEYMRDYGKKPGQLRPWMGILVEEFDAELHVVGLYQGSPAEKAGIIPGDIILSVDRQPVASMAGLFRTLWHFGPAGTDIPLTIRHENQEKNVLLGSIDRNSFFIQHTHHTYS